MDTKDYPMYDTYEGVRGSRIPTSMVQINNLQLPNSIYATNVWDQVKEQPGSITLSVYFREGFTSPTGEDDLSKSIHYGSLAKKVRADFAKYGSLTPAEALDEVGSSVLFMGRRSISDRRSVVSMMVAELHLSKASMTGDQITFAWFSEFDNDGGLEHVRKLIKIPNMRLMTVIGMNPHEREAKQPLVASLEYRYFAAHDTTSHDTPEREQFSESEALAVERTLANFIEKSQYETLELLAQHAIRLLREDFSSRGCGNAAVRLRLEKPKAIPFADAAVVELYVPA